MKKLLFIIILLPFVGIAQNVNRPYPKEFMGYEFKSYDSTFNESLLTTALFLNPTNGQYKNALMVLDTAGYTSWYSYNLAADFFQTVVDFKFNSKFNRFTFIKGESFFVMDTNFNLVDSITTTNGFLLDRHEFYMTNSGNYIVSGISDSVVDLSAYTFKGVAGSDTTHIQGFTIQEFDPNHNLIFQWDSNDELDPMEAYADFYVYDSAKFDYCHGNSIKKDLDGNYLVSFRHTNSVMKIDKNTGKIIWRLGGKRSDFVFVNDSTFSGQHDFKVLSNGNYILFDNGNMSLPRRPTRAVEYQLDTMSKTATKVWEYIHFPSVVSRAMGNYKRDSLGTQLIGYGLVNRPSPTAIMLDPNDTVIAQLSFFDTTVCYRVDFAQLKFRIVRPTISCAVEAGGIRLTAPSGLLNYAWSTGAVTQSILINQPGDYQVWVPQGIGMVGSEPIKVDDISTFCSVTSLIKSNVSPTEDRLVKVLDLNGREVSQPKENQLLIYWYESGKAKKVLWKGNK